MLGSSVDATAKGCSTFVVDFLKQAEGRFRTMPAGPPKRCETSTVGVRGWLGGKHWFAVKRHAGSLRWRVTLGATAILIGALTIAALASAGLVRRSLTQDLETTLDDRIDEVETLARAHMLPAVLEPTGREVGQVQVISSSGAVISGTAGLAQQVRFDLIAAPAVGRERAVTVNAERIDGDKGERFRLVVRKISVDDQEFGVWAISSLQAATNRSEERRVGKECA